MDLLRSPLIEVPHGFSTREGGASSGAYSSLNVGLNVGDDAERVHENLARVARAAAVEPGALCTVSQVHGDAVVEAPGFGTGPGVPPPFAAADAVWTERPHQAVAVKVADCVPLLLLDARRSRVAAVHAGWRGAIARLPEKLIAAWVARGTRPEDIRAAVGPCIRACCYEVDDALADRFAAAFGPAARVDLGARRHLDLVASVRASLGAGGVRPEQIDVVGGCTACDASRFFSHRRDRGVTGRQLGVIACG